MAETKVILTKSVNHLGHPGDVVSVKAGYARNYLIPQGLGFAWSKNAAAQIEAMKRARLAKAVATREEAVAAKDSSRFRRRNRRQGLRVRQAVRWHLRRQDRHRAVFQAAVNPKNITVDPIKTTGEFAATVALHPEISASFTVKVVAE